MDFNDTPEQAKFRKTCRDWLEKNAQLKDSSPSDEAFALNANINIGNRIIANFLNMLNYILYK